ncbi:myb-related transcription factor, partner of profilin-like [Saccostrea echinata]|uniref:myb-related transcription factor, partner of profilin-like n=1 Tax=Saccostrea echinata TaxID=191078 RepID=UPI002A7FC01B|nr:myb-related transcription factor, partner of profilin-like [Saccostrea echinata]XP_061183071.1 myb-related transcription factor, partner of profilin-like [Saccostrea echinata]
MSLKRCPNFSSAEITVLTDEVEKGKDILFSRQNSTVSNSLKKETWNKIATKVNAVNTTDHIRSGEEMKKKWTCLSSESRKKLALNRREQKKTGGGSLPSGAAFRPIDEKIEGIIGETSISGIEGGIDVLETESARETSPSKSTDAVNGSEMSYKGTRGYIKRSKNSCNDDITLRLVATEEERLVVEKKRLEMEEKRLKVEERRLEIAEQQLQIQREQHALHLCQLGIVRDATVTVNTPSENK